LQTVGTLNRDASGLTSDKRLSNLSGIAQAKPFTRQSCR
jgi:hypothetical protein